MANPSDKTFDPNGYMLFQNFRKRHGYDPKDVDRVLKFSGSTYERKTRFQKFLCYLKVQRYFWSLHTSTYFMDQTEAVLFLALLFTVFSLFFYAGYYYLPSYISYCSKKLMEYFPTLSLLWSRGDLQRVS